MVYLSLKKMVEDSEWNSQMAEKISNQEFYIQQNISSKMKVK